MFRALICPSSGVCDYFVELPHWLYCFWIAVFLESGCGSAGVVSAETAGSPDTTPAESHPDSKTQQSKNNTANLVVQQNNHKPLKMDILMP